MNYLGLLQQFFRLRANVKKTRAEITALQELRLRTLLCYAWDHSDWHRARFEQAGIARGQLASLPLAAFPTMSKRDLLTHFDEIVTVAGLRQDDLRRFDENDPLGERSLAGGYHVVHSSGSTGTPGYFVYDNAAWEQMLLGIIRGALWNMGAGDILRLLLGGPRVLYLAATGGRYGGAMAVGDGAAGLRAAQLHLDVNTPLTEWDRRIRAFRPNIIIGYPSAVKILGEQLTRGAAECEIRRVICCGEPLAPGLRRYLENAFGCDVVNFYGASESLALGVETGTSDGMVLFDDMNVIEIENGEMYLTSLYNYAQPLIRYRVSDRLTLREPAPGDPDPFTRADLVLGRCEDLLWFDDGAGGKEFLHPLSVEGFCIEGLRDYQFRQTGAGSFELLAEAAEGRRAAIENELGRQMAQILREKRLAHVAFEIRFVDRILPDPRTGKKKLILTGPAEKEKRA